MMSGILIAVAVVAGIGLVAAVVLGLFLALLLYIMKKKTAKEAAHE